VEKHKRGARGSPVLDPSSARWQASPIFPIDGWTMCAIVTDDGRCRSQLAGHDSGTCSSTGATVIAKGTRTEESLLLVREATAEIAVCAPPDLLASDDTTSRAISRDPFRAPAGDVLATERVIDNRTNVASSTRRGWRELENKRIDVYASLSLLAAGTACLCAPGVSLMAV
jgi:hypothetical protein